MTEIKPHTTRRLDLSAKSVAEAVETLRRGGLVAFPTETVYGLGADGTNEDAVAALYAAKGRPSFNPLIAHVAGRADAEREGVFSSAAATLAEAFWPGPLTLVTPTAATGQVCARARAGRSTVALRAPAHPVAQALLEAFRRPVVAPSANRSGRVSPTKAEHVLADLDGRIDIVLDGGDARVGVESTIVACIDDNIRILRPGGVSREAIEHALGRKLPEVFDEGSSDAPLAPGLLASHYAPRAKVRLDATTIDDDEACLDFGARFPAASRRLDLSERGDLAEAASRLFAYLRELDAIDVSAIAVAPIPNKGLGEAINDRLKRAAAPR